MALKLNSSSGGSVTLQEPTTASNYTLTVPAQTSTLATTVDAGNYYAFKNRIINGNMAIDQRNAGASVSQTPANTNVYTLDRWKFYGNTGTNKFTVQQNAGSVTPPTGFTNYLGVTSSSANTPAATDEYIIGQAVEGFNIADLGWGTANAATATLSFWVRSSLTGSNFGGAIKSSNSGYTFPFSFSIPTANTWTQISVVISGPSTGTFNTTNTTGITLFFNLGTGSTYLAGTSGAWTTTFSNGPTGSLNILGTNGATFYITGVQLEKGTVATSFDYRPYGTELALCQRYCEAVYATGSGADKDIGIGGGNGNAGNFQAFLEWKTVKRAAPTVSLAAASNFYVHVPGAFRVTCATLSANDASEWGVHLQGYSSSNSFGVGQQCFLAVVPNTTVIIASAEL